MNKVKRILIPGWLPVIMLPVMLFIIQACYYDSEEYLFPVLGSQCDTLNITYSGPVTAILSNKCLSCHSNNSAASFGGNIRLEDYPDVKSRADDQSLYGSIAHEQGYSPMPPGTPELSNCELATFRKWIDSGAPNN